MRPGNRLHARRHHPRFARRGLHRSRRLCAHQRRHRSRATFRRSCPDRIASRMCAWTSRWSSPTRRRQAPIAGRDASRPISAANGCSTMVAADLGIDQVEFRRRNLIAEADMPYALATVQVLDIVTECDSGDYQITLDRCLAEFGWAERAKLQGKLIDGPLPRHRHRLLSGRRRHRAEGERAARHRGRRQDLGLCRFVIGRPGRRDGVLADRRRRARSADGAHQQRVSWFDRLCH